MLARLEIIGFDVLNNFGLRICRDSLNWVPS